MQASSHLPPNSPVLILSPHLDDAWLSTAALIRHSQAEVWTVFAGAPIPAVATDWDRTCGFADSAETMAARLAEDLAAFADVDVVVRHLPYLDAAYADGPTRRLQTRGLRDDLTAWLGQHPDGLLALPICAGVHVAPAFWETLRERVRGEGGAMTPNDALKSSTATDQAGVCGRPEVKALAAQTVRRLMHADHQRRRRKAQRRGMAANPDHVLVRGTGLEVASAVGADVLFWEDLPYLWHARGHDQARRLATASTLDLIELTLPVDVEDKYARLQKYTSQVDVLDPIERRLSTPGHLPTTETYWLGRRRDDHD